MHWRTRQSNSVSISTICQWECETIAALRGETSAAGDCEVSTMRSGCVAMGCCVRVNLFRQPCRDIVQGITHSDAEGKPADGDRPNFAGDRDSAQRDDGRGSGGLTERRCLCQEEGIKVAIGTLDDDQLAAVGRG